MIEFYIAICILLLIFNVVFVFRKNIEMMYFANSTKHFQRYILKIYGKYDVTKGLDNKTKKKIKVKLGKVKYLVAMHETLQMLKPINLGFEEEVKICVWSQVNKYLKKTNEQQAYFAYVVSTFNYQEVIASDDNMMQFMNYLNTDSLYTLTNTMDAICNLNNTYMVHSAINIINNSNIFYHKKLFTQSLLNFKGKEEELQQILMVHFEEYNNVIKEGILDYFRLKNVQASEFYINILENNKQDMEIIYATMRCLGQYPTQTSKIFFQSVLDNESENWIKELLAVKGLIHFQDSMTKKLIYDRVTHANWDVRCSAIEYFITNFLQGNELQNILGLNDKYANEALIYRYAQVKKRVKVVG